ncbi:MULTISPECIES: DUF3566 domain-containing protein [Mycolicibacter]|uniref:DUF3566 domain-containing protein n=1 Tax=Mycolicibacter sinensis (strain JDM601) TaxID=875328 RepID=A0A1A2P273_MYCSD|nr:MULTISPECIES: DUF3566 domain-containing protein [Mycolicibacter]OBH21401.1 hypothetical protein A5694_13270 [Mycolicibacter sinensis]OBI34318.1 hypothetical protein A5710_11825 [Mycolicibacter sinensis]
MSAPKEPGHPGNGPGKAESPASGSVDAAGQRPAGRPGRITETGEAPPWQRGGQGRQPGPSRAADPARPADPGAAHSPGVDERLRRFISGTAAPAAAQPASAKPAKPAGQQSAKPAGQQSAKPAQPSASEDAYGSELPDLSEPAHRRPAARRPPVTAGPRGPVRASMQIRRIDPWSALKVSLLLSTALFFVWMIAVAVLYVLLGAMGVWSKLNSNVGDLLTNNSAAELVSGSSIFGGAALIGLVNVVVLTAMATLGVVIYNLSTDVVGGVEVTLADRD